MTKPTIIAIPVLDTGIGIEAGYKSDADMLEHAGAEREERLSALSPTARARTEEMERDFDKRLERRILFGDDGAPDA